MIKSKIGFLLVILPLFQYNVHSQDFSNITDHTCYDGDSCKVTIPDLPEVFGDHISIRFKGIDTPEIRGKCGKEKALARVAGVRVRARFSQDKAGRKRRIG